MYCRQCGFNIGDNSNFCPACGAPQQQQQVQNINFGQSLQNEPIGTYFENEPENIKSRDGGLVNIFWGLISFIPIVGFILYFTWKTKFPKRAKICLWCGVIGFVVNMYYLSGSGEEAVFGLVRILTKS